MQNLQVRNIPLGLPHALSEETYSSFQVSQKFYFWSAWEYWEESTCLSKQKRWNEIPQSKDAQTDISLPNTSFMPNVEILIHNTTAEFLDFWKGMKVLTKQNLD